MKSPNHGLVLVIVFCQLIISVVCLWPKPPLEEYGKETVELNPFHFLIEVQKPHNPTILSAVERYMPLLFPFTPDIRSADIKQLDTTQKQLIRLEIKINSTDEQFTFPIDERYTLGIQKSFRQSEFSHPYEATITAPNCYGAIRGLETFSQLITSLTIDDSHQINRNWEDENYRPTPHSYSYQVSNVPLNIVDSPRFSWRGLLFDTARHFAPVWEIKHLLDVMSWTKFNVLHWHITDEQSYPLQSHAYPEIVRGSWDTMARYTWKDVRDIIEFARLRGIHVVPEIDMPGHSKSWGAAFPHIITSCTDPSDRKVHSVLNLGEPLTYNITRAIIDEVSELFPTEFFHFGVDEVSYACYSTPDFRKATESFLQEHWLVDSADLFNYFINFAFSEAQVKHKTPIVWEELAMQTNFPVPKNVIIEAWRNWGVSAYEEMLEKGYKSLLSTGWYLDWVDKKWSDYYKVNKDKLSWAQLKHKDLAIGGECCMWSERVDQTSREVIIWPRAAAIAESLWSHSIEDDLTVAERRLETWRCTMLHRGLHAPPLMPDYCDFREIDTNHSRASVVDFYESTIFGYVPMTNQAASPSDAPADEQTTHKPSPQPEPTPVQHEVPVHHEPPKPETEPEPQAPAHQAPAEPHPPADPHPQQHNSPHPLIFEESVDEVKPDPEMVEHNHGSAGPVQHHDLPVVPKRSPPPEPESKSVHETLTFLLGLILGAGVVAAVIKYWPKKKNKGQIIFVCALLLAVLVFGMVIVAS